MRAGIAAVIVVLLGSAPAPVSAAEFSTVFVVPGRPGVPVVINGWDASFTVVEGEFGLDRPGQVNPVIVGGPLITPAPLHYGPYFPRLGRRPGYGRFEIEPPANRRLPPPAQSYYRVWSSQSDPLPASLDPPALPPDVSVNINGDGGDWRRDDRELRRKERELRRAERDLRRHRSKRGHHGGGHHPEANSRVPPTYQPGRPAGRPHRGRPMIKHPLHALAVSAVVSLGAATQAAAGCCPTCDCGSVPVPRSYLVNQGPVFSGPGHYVAQIHDAAPRRYPYVGFVFSGYPYGYYNPYVGAPRRFYRPW